MKRKRTTCCDKPSTADGIDPAPDHTSELHRIKRIEGQIAGVRRMIEERSYCPEILVQTKAIGAAIRALELALLERHLTHCVDAAYRSGSAEKRRQKIKELVGLLKGP